MAEETATNIGSASHLGANEFILDGHFANDYSKRRVPLPVNFYMGVADTVDSGSPTDLNGKWVLSVLYEYLNPAFIADEQMDADGMQPMIESAFQKVNQRVIQECASRNIEGGHKLSMTVVIAGSGQAFIGHAGDCKAFLHSGLKLFDITPNQAQETIIKSEAETPALFTVQETTDAPTAEEGNPAPPAAEETAASSKGKYIGESDEVALGFGETEIIPGDTVILCTDGLHKNIPQPEIAENLNTSFNLDRVANQLVRLAFSRNSTDNATFAALKYAISSIAGTDYGIHRRAQARKAASEKFIDAMVFLMLGIVLFGILGLGFAFGWKIADAFQGPDQSKTTATKSTQSNKSNEVVVKVDAQTPVSTIMVIEGSGVRMRNTPSVQGKVLGLLSDGQEVTVLEEVDGSDGKKWSRISGTVRSNGKDIASEGYISNEFLKEPGAKAKQSSTSTTPSTTPQSTTPN